MPDPLSRVTVVARVFRAAVDDGALDLPLPRCGARALAGAGRPGRRRPVRRAWPRRTSTRSGGLPPLALAEDHALVAALAAAGLRVARPSALPVVTSARREPRCEGGFGALLASLADR